MLLIALAGCGSDETPDEAAPLSPTVAATLAPPTFVPPTAPPTWTPSSVPPTDAPPATRPPLPTSTRRPSATPLPEPSPGAVFDPDSDRLTVTVLTDGVNTAIADLYYAQSDPAPVSPPVITLDYGGRARIELVYYDDFLDRSSRVILAARIEITGGRIALAEIPDSRESTGAMVAESSIWAGLALAEDGLNHAVTSLAGSLDESQAGALVLESARGYSGYLEAVFRVIPPVG